MKLNLTYVIPNEQPRQTARDLASTTGESLMLNELIAWLSPSTLNEFLTDFAEHLESGDFDDIFSQRLQKMLTTDPLFPVELWKDDVTNNRTLLDYWTWKEQLEENRTQHGFDD